jgi:hypothetical protein
MVFSLEHDIKVTKNHQNLLPTQSVLVAHPVLGIHDLFGTELAMIFSFHVGLTDSVMQRMQFFFCQCLFDIFLPPPCQIYYFNIR